MNTNVVMSSGKELAVAYLSENCGKVVRKVLVMESVCDNAVIFSEYMFSYSYKCLKSQAPFRYYVAVPTNTNIGKAVSKIKKPFVIIIEEGARTIISSEECNRLLNKVK